MMKTIPAEQIFSGLAARRFLRPMNIPLNNPDLDIAWGLIFGSSAKTLEARRKSHLTHSTSLEHQIRFPLQDRVFRCISHLASAVADILKISAQKNICIEVPENDYLAKEFFTSLKSFGVSVTCLKVTKDKSHPHNNWNAELRPEELQVLRFLKDPESHQEALWTFSRERVYSGDYQTARRILQQIPTESRTDSTHHLLGLCCNFFNETDQSELHFQRLMQSSNPLSQAKASYLLAMLNLRMHPPEKRDLSKAEELLIWGREQIEKNPQIEDYLFHSVFNRNGYALCLFRRGKVEEALAMLESGILRLQESKDGAKQLHGSVLIYNSVQCLRQIKDFKRAEERCQALLQIDPLFPEYWLELARTYLEQKKWNQSLQPLARAESLDPRIPEIYALRAFAFLETEQIRPALTQYKKALALNPTSTELKLDIEYCRQTLGEK